MLRSLLKCHASSAGPGNTGLGWWICRSDSFSALLRERLRFEGAALRGNEPGMKYKHALLSQVR